jgi:hypothetical protein
MNLTGSGMAMVMARYHGTMVGDDEAGNRTGVAPKRWIVLNCLITRDTPMRVGSTL